MMSRNLARLLITFAVISNTLLLAPAAIAAEPKSISEALQMLNSANATEVVEAKKYLSSQPVPLLADQLKIIELLATTIPNGTFPIANYEFIAKHASILPRVIRDNFPKSPVYGEVASELITLFRDMFHFRMMMKAGESGFKPEELDAVEQVYRGMSLQLRSAIHNYVNKHQIYNLKGENSGRRLSDAKLRELKTQLAHVKELTGVDLTTFTEKEFALLPGLPPVRHQLKFTVVNGRPSSVPSVAAVAEAAGVQPSPPTTSSLFGTTVPVHVPSSAPVSGPAPLSRATVTVPEVDEETGAEIFSFDGSAVGTIVPETHRDSVKTVEQSRDVASALDKLMAGSPDDVQEGLKYLGSNPVVAIKDQLMVMDLLEQVIPLTANPDIEFVQVVGVALSEVTLKNLDPQLRSYQVLTELLDFYENLYLFRLDLRTGMTRFDREVAEIYRPIFRTISSNVRQAIFQHLTDRSELRTTRTGERVSKGQLEILQKRLDEFRSKHGINLEREPFYALEVTSSDAVEIEETTGLTSEEIEADEIAEAEDSESLSKWNETDRGVRITLNEPTFDVSDDAQAIVDDSNLRLKMRLLFRKVLMIAPNQATELQFTPNQVMKFLDNLDSELTTKGNKQRYGLVIAELMRVWMNYREIATDRDNHDAKRIADKIYSIIEKCAHLSEVVEWRRQILPMGVKLRFVGTPAYSNSYGRVGMRAAKQIQSILTQWQDIPAKSLIPILRLAAILPARNLAHMLQVVREIKPPQNLRGAMGSALVDLVGAYEARYGQYGPADRAVVDATEGALAPAIVMTDRPRPSARANVTSRANRVNGHQANGNGGLALLRPARVRPQSARQQVPSSTNGHRNGNGSVALNGNSRPELIDLSTALGHLHNAENSAQLRLQALGEIMDILDKPDVSAEAYDKAFDALTAITPGDSRTAAIVPLIVEILHKHMPIYASKYFSEEVQSKLTTMIVRYNAKLARGSRESIIMAQTVALVAYAGAEDSRNVLFGAGACEGAFVK